MVPQLNLKSFCVIGHLGILLLTLPRCSNVLLADTNCLVASGALDDQNAEIKKAR